MSDNYLGQLYVIAAPSGAGKTSLVRALVEKMKHLHISVSHTTRPMRPNEEDGKHYFFTDKAEFEHMIEHNLFLEHAVVFDNYYGTSRAWVEDKVKAGEDVILEIDWQGAEQVLEQYPKCKRIFILPPSQEELERRLRTRAQDDEAVIAKRLAEAQKEVAACFNFDYLIINDDFLLALSDLEALVRSHRLRMAVQKKQCADILDNWF